LIEPIHLRVLLFRQRVQPLAHPDVTGRAGADAAAAVADLRAALFGRLEQRGALRYLDRHVLQRRDEVHLRHQYSSTLCPWTALEIARFMIRSTKGLLRSSSSWIAAFSAR